jgi:hypothetical protein
MKSLIITAASVCFLLSFTIVTPVTKISTSDKCKEMLDSADVMIEVGEFSINWRPCPLRDGKRSLALDKWFTQRSREEVVCFLTSPNKLHRLYGYILTKAYFGFGDSLVKQYDIGLAGDTSSFQFCTVSGGLEDTHLTLGEMFKMIDQKLDEDIASLKKKPVVEEKVKAFIEKYATWPATYKPLSFPDYYFGGQSSDATIYYGSKHVYEIKNNNGQQEKITNRFLFGPALDITSIELDSIDHAYSNPPLLGEWFKNYGRQLTGVDSAVLHLK